MPWKIFYWKKSSQRSPVEEFIDDLPIKVQVKIRNLYRYILEFGPNIGPPQMKFLVGYKPLIEFRVLGQDAVRLIAWVDGEAVIFCHVFRKKSNKTPIKELELAYKRYLQK